MSKKITILQISDLHAGECFSKETKSESIDYEKCCEELFKSFQHLIDRYTERPIDILVLNGDLVCMGRDEEYMAIVEHFVEKLLLAMKDEIIFNNVVVVPGNHDVDWEVVRRKLKSDNADSKKSNSPLKKFRHTIKNIQNIFPGGGRLVTSPFTPGDDFDVLTLDSPFKCEIAPFNSVNLGGTPNPDVEYFKHLLKLKIKENGSRVSSYEVLDDLTNEIPPIDPAFIDPEDMTKCREKLNNSQGLRIAVLHHNPIPYKEEKYADSKPYRFMNDGAFNSFLIERDFNLVLHGHQHQPKCFYLSGLSAKRSTVIRMSDAGYLCIGAPAFGAKDAEALGFNFITIEQKNSKPEFVSVTVETITKTYDSSGGYDPISNECSYLLPVSKISDNRLKIFTDIAFLESDSQKLQEVENILRPKEAEIKETKFFKRVRNLRSEYRDIRALYSLSVFEPKLWDDKRLIEFFLPEARRNIGYAAALAKKYEYKNKMEANLESGFPSLRFLFSDPLCKAIQTAKENSRKLEVVTRLRTTLASEQASKKLRERIGERAYEYLQRCVLNGKVDERKDSYDSLSIWDNVRTIKSPDHIDSRNWDIDAEEVDNIGKYLSTANVGDMNVSISKLNWRPVKNFGDIPGNQDKISSLLEFPRILLWEDNQFAEKQAFACIEFHENCAFPLFWLQPKKVWGEKVEKARKTGYFIIFAESHCTYPTSKNYFPVREANDKLWTMPDGSEPEFDPDWMDMKRVYWIWKNSPPASLIKVDNREPTLVDEFMLFLKRPDIVFAADAWAMWALGEDIWEELIKHIHKLDPEINKWFNAKSIDEI